LFLLPARRVTRGKTTSTIRISPFLPQSAPNACAQRNETGSPETTSKTLSIATSHQPSPKDLRRAVEKELLGQLWEGKVDAAIELLKGALEWVRNPAAVEELIAYLEKRRAYIPDYQQRQRAGLWIASTRVEKYNDWAVSARCKHQGMSWSPQGVLALAALEAARRNGELDA